jgi:hypothetical protein
MGDREERLRLVEDHTCVFQGKYIKGLKLIMS